MRRFPGSVRLLLGFLALGVPVATTGQPVEPVLPGIVLEPAESSLRRALEQEGRLLIERRHRLASLPFGDGRLEIEAVIVHEPPHEQDRVLGVRVRPVASGFSKSAMLDLHEVDDLARSLAIWESLIAAEERSADVPVEIRFRTKEGFVVALEMVGPKTRGLITLDGQRREVPVATLKRLATSLDSARRFLFSR